MLFSKAATPVLHVSTRTLDEPPNIMIESNGFTFAMSSIAQSNPLIIQHFSCSMTHHVKILTVVTILLKKWLKIIMAVAQTGLDYLAAGRESGLLVC